MCGLHDHPKLAKGVARDFMARKAEFDGALDRLQALSARGFDVQRVDWGHVAMLCQYVDLLTHIEDRIAP